VRAIFARYLALGSMGALMEDLDRRGIRTKARRRTDGRVIGGIRFGIGPLAYLLKEPVLHRRGGLSRRGPSRGAWNSASRAASFNGMPRWSERFRSGGGAVRSCNAAAREPRRGCPFRKASSFFERSSSVVCTMRESLVGFGGDRASGDAAWGTFTPAWLTYQHLRWFT
jgi:hypothetical protein